MYLSQMPGARFAPSWNSVMGAARDLRRRLNRASATVAMGVAAGAMFCAPAAYAETYKVSVGEIPATPILLEILKGIEAANPDVKFEVTVRPFPAPSRPCWRTIPRISITRSSVPPMRHRFPSTFRPSRRSDRRS